jgi:xylulokinase
VRLVGGGSRNRLWRSLVADLLGAPVALPIETESAAFGAALQALWTLGRAGEPGLAADEIASAHVHVSPTRTEPDPDRAAALAPVRERFRDRVAALLRAGG